MNFGLTQAGVAGLLSLALVATAVIVCCSCSSSQRLDAHLFSVRLKSDDAFKKASNSATCIVASGNFQRWQNVAVFECAYYFRRRF